MTIAVVVALGIGAGIALLATSGDDDASVTTQRQDPTTSPTTTSTTSRLTTTLPPAPPPITVPPVTPGTVVINPSLATTAPTAVPPTAASPTASTTASTTTSSPPVSASDIGITPTQIRLAVITDDSATRRGVTAWANTINRNGGLAGRKIRLDHLTTGHTAAGYAEAVTTACARDFAIVGSRSAFDAATESLIACQIPDLPIRVTADAHREAPTTFPVVPERPGTVPVGGFKWLLTNVTDCCAQYALVPTEEPARSRALASVDAATAIGFTDLGTVEVAEDEPASSYTEFVGQITDRGANFVRGAGPDSTIALRQEAAAQGIAGVSTWYCDDACYSQEFLADGDEAVDGQYVEIGVTPLSEKAAAPGVRAYVSAARRARQQPTLAGLEGYAAGLLFENAARKVIEAEGPNGLTRDAVVTALSDLHDFSAAGILGPTDIGNRAPSGCFVLLRVGDGKFTRAFPSKAGQLDCQTGNLLTE